MDFSVIICTYNRARNLPTCIDHLSQQKGVEDLRWEILVVDNNSSDDTAATVDRLTREKSVQLRYTFEPQQGLNHARNRGMQESAGKYFCYVDDDILVSPRWLISLYRTLEDNDADAAGSCIHLDANIRMPKWIQPEMYGFLGYQDYGPTPFQMDGVKQYPFGGNMAFNRRVLDKVGLFNTLLGRKGEGRKRDNLFKGAETDYFHRLASTGARIFYTPDAVVYHQILPFQLEKSYFRTIHFNAGYQKAYFDAATYSRNVCGIPLFLFSQLIRNIGKYLAQILTKGPDLAFRQQMIVGHFLGKMAGYVKRARDNAGNPTDAPRKPE